jgi:hypothetical protein
MVQEKKRLVLQIKTQKLLPTALEQSKGSSTSAQISGTEATVCTENPYPLKNSDFVFNYSSFYFG